MAEITALQFIAVIRKSYNLQMKMITEYIEVSFLCVMFADATTEEQPEEG